MTVVRGLEQPVVMAVPTITKDNYYGDNVHVNKILLDRIKYSSIQQNKNILRINAVKVPCSTEFPFLISGRASPLANSLCRAHIHPSLQT